MNARAGFTTTKHRRVIVIRSQMIGCDWQTLAAWTPFVCPPWGGYGTVTHDDAGVYLGMIGTEYIDTTGLPALTTRRLWTVRSIDAERVALAHSLILRAFPELEGKTRPRRAGMGAELDTYAPQGSIDARRSVRDFLVPAYLLETSST
jgi:hypothetical protein